VTADSTADRLAAAEAKLAQAPHAYRCGGSVTFGVCTCWKSAPALDAARADVWDEGFAFGFHADQWRAEDNPYRAPETGANDANQ
jgi:hypothetical protein